MSETPLFTPAQTPTSIEETLASVTTGQPTIPVASTSGTDSKTLLTSSPAVSEHNVSLSLVPVAKVLGRSKKPQKIRTLPPKVPVKKSGKGKSLSKRTSRNNKTNGKSPKEGSAHTVIAYSDVSETVAGANQEADLITVGTSRVRSSQGAVNNVNKPGEQSVSEEANRKESNKERGDHSSDEDDIDIEIDIENDDEENSVLQSRSTSPSSVYKLLLKSADIDTSQKRCSKSDNENMSSLTNSQIKANESTPEELFTSDPNESLKLEDSKSIDADLSGEKDNQLSYSTRPSPDENSHGMHDEEDEEEEEHHIKTETIGEPVSHISTFYMEFNKN